MIFFWLLLSPKLLIQHQSLIRIMVFHMRLYHQGRQFLSISALQRVMSPANCFILGWVHPPKALKSLKACKLSQWAYQRGTDPGAVQAEVLPNMFSQLLAEEYTPAAFPLPLIALMASVKKAQLLAESCPDQEHPELGLVQTSIHMVVQRLPEIPPISSLTCAVAFLPRQGNIQTSVVSPAVLAF